VSKADAIFREAAAESRVEGIPLAHLSVELGHLYMEDFAAGPDRIRRQFERVAPWAKTAAEVCAASMPGRRARISTCFLVDDYFTRFSSPAEVVPQLIEAARENGLEIDYLARESGCAKADGVPLARMVESRLVADPSPGTNGSRPPTTTTGWLSNGQRSPAGSATEAMRAATPWAPPAENGANRHSIFADIELWDEVKGERIWSCPYLAAVWQLLRLGMLRHFGEAVAVPQAWDGEKFPEDWDRLPAVVRLNPSAAPFSAYRTMSVLAARFLHIEHAVQTILGQVAVEPAVLEQVTRRAGTEKLALPVELADRIEYIFISE
jgi:hypothetical protein